MKPDELILGQRYIYPESGIKVMAAPISIVLSPINPNNDIGAGIGAPVIATEKNTKNLVIWPTVQPQIAQP